MNRLASKDAALPPSTPAPRTSDFPAKYPIPPSMFDSAALAAAMSAGSKPFFSKANVSRNLLEKASEPDASQSVTLSPEMGWRVSCLPSCGRSLSCFKPAARTTRSTVKGA